MRESVANNNLEVCNNLGLFIQEQTSYKIKELKALTAILNDTVDNIKEWIPNKDDEQLKTSLYK